MVRNGLACFGVTFALVLTTAGQDDALKALKSADARRAVADYDKAMKQAQEEFDRDVDSARKRVLADLESAQEKAVKANQLDDAVLIRDLRKGYEEAASPAPKDGNLQVVSAFYGQNVSWLDVTDRIRRAMKGKAKWSAVVVTKDWGEPAPGFTGPRTLIVRYTVGGEAHFKAVYQGQKIVIP